MNRASDVIFLIALIPVIWLGQWIAYRAGYRAGRSKHEEELARKQLQISAPK